ncbi:MAG TPA: Asp-tRNA(Asn)/Glu-tRNA(Gln) amidotransferase subunit GatB, partial [Planctomycetaceae bacterium]|nr:Asp-tRNA(Asn)/Glu-tRNA(Gln) amidotransferase subunit GatB [Planctomycetaceae bacterium]
MHCETIIGLEVHVQLQTQTKIFCGCSTAFNPDNPNVQTCPVCLGLPGALPVMNRTAFRLALKTALALNCQIARFTKWDRKQYYYPDLPKGYQISQYDLPFSFDGWVEIDTDVEKGETKQVRLIRAHLEEDAGKNLHDETGRGHDSLVDLNRAGTPLLEIVSQPDLRSAAEAKTFLEELKLLLSYIGVSDCNMQEGSLRCDANVNLHVHTGDGQTIATPIVEIKNLNSFRGVEQAIEFEVARQFEEWKQTRHGINDVPKQTRGWDAHRGVTFAQRGKEEASDYRYFPDPDLTPITVSDEFLAEVRSELCELPAARRRRFQTQYGLSHYDADVIVAQGDRFTNYFEQVAQLCGDGKQAANWLTQDVLRVLNTFRVSISDSVAIHDSVLAQLERYSPEIRVAEKYANQVSKELEPFRGTLNEAKKVADLAKKHLIDAFPIMPDVLGNLLKRVTANQITVKSAREVFDALLADHTAATENETAVDLSTARVERIIAERGLAILTDTSA